MHFSDLSDYEKGALALALLMLPFIGMMVWNHYERSAVERDKAIERCHKAEDTDICLAGIEARHSDCMSASSVGGGRFTRSSIHPGHYDYCVRHGVEELSKQK